MSQIYFISGIDTDSGKTIVTGLIAKFLLSHNKSVVTQKLVQSDCIGISDDIKIHRKLMGIDLLPEDISMLTCPFVFAHPSSPELAASLENKVIDVELIYQNTRKLADKFEYVLIEGAGGLMVPITKDKMIIDIICENQYELILVSCPKLGSINHTLLSLEVCRKYKVKLKALVYNHFPFGDIQIFENTRNVIYEYLKRNFPETVIIDVPVIMKNENLNIEFQPLL